MHRLYCGKSPLTKEEMIITDKDEIHHLRKVLRLKKGAKLTLFNSHREEGEGTILSLSGEKVILSVTNTDFHKAHYPRLILACSIPKKSKFELIIEKATELGADEIIPLRTERTEIKLTGDRLKKKILRYQNIAINAAKQSKRYSVPVIHPITNFDLSLDLLPKETKKIIPCLSGKRIPLIDHLTKQQKAKSIAIFIGPEGDFTEKEYDTARKRGCVGVSLGPTTLKVETAALCALSCTALACRDE